MKKIGNFIMIFAPFVVYLLLQVLAGAYGAVLFGVHLRGDLPQTMPKILLLIHLLGSLIFLVWYREVCVRRSEAETRQVFKPLPLGGVVLLALGLEFSVIMLLNLTYVWLSKWIDQFGNAINQAGIGQGSLPALLATVLLAPVAEECAFRGVTMAKAEKAFSSFAVINLVQAFLFGLYHLNIIQGSYAFVFGLFLGYIAHKFSVKLSVVMHMLINFLAVLPVGIKTGSSRPVQVLVLLASLLLVIAGMAAAGKAEKPDRPMTGKPTALTAYRVYTALSYRFFVNIFCPLLLAVIGAVIVFLLVVSGSQAQIPAFLVSLGCFYCVIECSGDYFAFAGICRKDASFAAFFRSAPYGKKFMCRIFGLDIGLRLFKTAVLFVIAGGAILAEGDYLPVLLAFFATGAVTTGAVNFTRRLDSFQLIFLVTLPAGLLLMGMLYAAVHFTDLQVLLAVLYAVLLIAAVVLTYRVMTRLWKL